MTWYLKKLTKQFIHKHFSPKFIHLLRKTYFLYALNYHKIFQDEEELSVVSRIVQPNDIVMDIGANIGLYTVFVSRLLSDKGRLLSFEPIPESYDILKNNVKWLCGGKASVFQLALSDRVGSIDMLIPRDHNEVENLYLSHIRPDSPRNDNSRIVNIQTNTVDNILLKYSAGVDFIKCDVEGAELLVFRGAEKSIKQYTPHIMCEISAGHIRYGYTAKAIFDYLRHCGYLSYVYESRALVNCRGFIKGFPNYFFIHSTKTHSICPIFKTP